MMGSLVTTAPLVIIQILMALLRFLRVAHYVQQDNTVSKLQQVHALNVRVANSVVLIEHIVKIVNQGNMIMK